MTRTGQVVSVIPFACVLLLSCERGVEKSATPVPAAAPVREMAPGATLAPAEDKASGPAGLPSPATGGRVAVAELKALGGGAAVVGHVSFSEVDNETRIEAFVNGLSPGSHGLHIHEFGDCSAPDGTSAGAHFNPDSVLNGPFEATQPHHSGDLGNLVADASGQATLSAVTSQFTLAPGARSIAGRAVVIHQDADDLTSQPAGDAGKRIACGVILGSGASSTPLLKGAP